MPQCESVYFLFEEYGVAHWLIIEHMLICVIVGFHCLDDVTQD